MSATTPLLQALTYGQVIDRLQKKFGIMMSERTLRSRITEGRGPPVYRDGRRVYMVAEEVDRWIFSFFRRDPWRSASEAA